MGTVKIPHRRGAEIAEITQRKTGFYTPSFSSSAFLCVLCVSAVIFHFSFYSAAIGTVKPLRADP
jgi:hypothetical protein